jgi:hypothetical protein
MQRCAITTVQSLRKILADLPDDHMIGTNRVGNLAVYKPCGGSEFLQIGYIDLMNIEYFDGTCPDAEFTSTEDPDEAEAVDPTPAKP